MLVMNKQSINQLQYINDKHIIPNANVINNKSDNHVADESVMDYHTFYSPG